MADQPQFQVHMVGSGVSPETVRAGELAEFLVNLETAVTETTLAQEATSFLEPDDVLVSLVRIERGSESLTFAVADVALPSVGTISGAISSGNYDPVPYAAQEALWNISKLATRRKWSVEFIPDEQFHIQRAVISRESPVPAPSAHTVVGPTTIWGHLVRVGGSIPKAVIRLRNGSLLSVAITAELARSLGALIYRDVGIEGRARWRVGDWKILDFKVSGVVEYRPDDTSLTQTFEDLTKASQGRWNEVDASEYVRNLRSEGGS